jgi:hypothetical protein
VANKKEKQPWTISKTATVSFVASTSIFLLAYFSEPTKAAAPASMLFWALKYAVPVLVTSLISFFALGWKRPDRKQALTGAFGGAIAGPVIGWVLSFVLLFIPIFGWLALPLTSLVGRALSAYLSALGTMLGELKDDPKA